MHSDVLEYEQLTNWGKRFFRLSEEVASWSKDPSTKVGCVIIDTPSNQILSVGFNGFPSGVRDDPSLLDSREEKYARVLHAEENAILNCRTYDLTNAFVFVTHPPCSHCAAVLVQKKVAGVYAIEPSDEFKSRYAKSLEISKDMFRQGGVEFRLVSR